MSKQGQRDDESFASGALQKQPTPDPIRGGEAAKPPAASGDGLPTAGPHADPSLINPEATPGTGALPPPGDQDNIDSTSG